MLRENRVHCIEGALFAAAALWLNGEKPFLLDLKATNRDFDHVAALFRRRGLCDAINKTNHAVLRYREPIFRNVIELVFLIFTNILTIKVKTLQSFSEPFDVLRFAKSGWAISEKNFWCIAKALDKSPYFPILPKAAIIELRPADLIEIEAGKLTQWK